MLDTNLLDTEKLMAEAEAIVLAVAAPPSDGFLTRAQTDTLTLAGHPFDTMEVVIRFGCTRVISCVRQVRQSILAAEKGGDYVRDVAFTVNQLRRVRRTLW